MSVLGHKSVQMALVYAHVSDPAVLDDNRTVLGADTTIAGPSASAVRNRELTPETVEWPKDNFFRTETRARPLPAAAGRRPVRVRPVPDLREVHHHLQVRPTAT